MKRRQFLQMVAMAAGGVALTACGQASHYKVTKNGNIVPNNNGAQRCGPVQGAVTYTNPGHNHTTFNLTVSQIATASPGNYTLLGGGHSHTFNLTAPDFQKLKAGQSVTKIDLEGDGHSIMISC